MTLVFEMEQLTYGKYKKLKSLDYLTDRKAQQAVVKVLRRYERRRV